MHSDLRFRHSSFTPLSYVKVCCRNILKVLILLLLFHRAHLCHSSYSSLHQPYFSPDLSFTSSRSSILLPIGSYLGGLVLLQKQSQDQSLKKHSKEKADQKTQEAASKSGKRDRRTKVAYRGTCSQQGGASAEPKGEVLINIPCLLQGS